MTRTPTLSANHRSAGDCVRPIANAGAHQPFGSSRMRTLQHACQPGQGARPGLGHRKLRLTDPPTSLRIAIAP
jgi:hypothetical protein